MVAGLVLTSVAVWGFSVVDGYWPLVAMVVLAREASVVHRVASFGATPDIFGRSRWVIALVALTVTTLVPGALTLAFIRATWDQDDPSTWDPTFRLAAVGLAIAAVVVALLVREAPASRAAAAAAARRTWREELRMLLAMPNLPVLLAGGFLLAAAAASTARLLPVWANEVMGAGGKEMVDASVASSIGFVLTLPLGLWLAARFHPRRLAVAACLFGAAVTFGHVWVTTLWVFIAAAIVVMPLTVAAVVAGVPLLLRIVPRAENVGESYGMLAGPVGIGTSVAAYASAATVDVLGDYRVIWAFSAAFLVGAAVAFSRLAVPPELARTDVNALLRQARDAGRGGAGRLFGGTVEERDVLGETSATVTGSQPS
jgi:Na+/melibiose symporter-like transporter